MKRQSLKAFLSALALLLASGCAIDHAKPDESSSEAILKRIDEGGKPYFQDLVRTGEYDDLLNAIEAGDEVLITGAPRLIPYVDASTSTGLKFALSRAVKHNPDAVMKLIPEHYDANQLCTIPYIEQSIVVELRHVWDSLAALRSSSNLTAAHADCIEIYMQAEQSIAHWLKRHCAACFPPQ